MKRSDSPKNKSFRTEIILTVLLVVLTIASGRSRSGWMTFSWTS